jgi:curved DNA-binding protein CbpA
MTSEHSDRRKYPRIRVPKGMWVGWRSAGQTTASRAENMGLGGLYLHVLKPPSKGTTIELIFDLPAGEIRARAIVRSSTPAKGMGLQFVQMRPEDRAKLNRYLSGLEASQKASAVPPAADSRPANAYSEKSQLVVSPDREKAAQLRFEQELRHLIELTGKGTYYQLLGVTPDCQGSQIKKSYYSLARKFHPDNHVGSRELTRVRDLMIVITEAYKTLENEDKRTAYDKRLAALGSFSMHREKTEAEESLEKWLERANECLRAKNFVGSIVWLRKCVESVPEKALYRATLARSLATIPQYRNEAIEQFQKAIDLDPWSEPVYLHFAELLEKMQLPVRARGIYSKLLEINPTDTTAAERLAALENTEHRERSSPRISRLFDRKR